MLSPLPQLKDLLNIVTQHKISIKPVSLAGYLPSA